MRPRLRTSPGPGVPGSQQYPGWWGRGHPGAAAAPVLAHDPPAPAEGKEGYTVKVAAVRSVEEPRPPQCHQMLLSRPSVFDFVVVGA